LTGPAIRGADSLWSGEEPTNEPDRVYLFEGDGDPVLLRNSPPSKEPQFVYEVQPMGEVHSDGVVAVQWRSVWCESAIVVACVYRPPRDPE